MDAVSAEILSTRPISLSKAASVLSSFISAGADAELPQSTAAYLSRTLEAFDELVSFHRGGAKEKSKKRRRSPTSSGGLETISETGSQTEKKKKKKKSKKRRIEESHQD